MIKYKLVREGNMIILKLRNKNISDEDACLFYWRMRPKYGPHLLLEY